MKKLDFLCPYQYKNIALYQEISVHRRNTYSFYGSSRKLHHFLLTISTIGFFIIFRISIWPINSCSQSNPIARVGRTKTILSTYIAIRKVGTKIITSLNNKNEGFLILSEEKKDLLFFSKLIHFHRFR